MIMMMMAKMIPVQKIETTFQETMTETEKQILAKTNRSLLLQKTMLVVESRR